MRLSRLLLPALIVLAPGAVPAQSIPLEPLDSIVAVVDQDVVLRSELDLGVANIAARFNPSQLPPRNVLERQVLERLVLIKLQVERARGSGIRVADAEMEQAIGTIAAQQGVSVEQLRAGLAKDGIPYEEFRNSVREEMLVQRLRQRIAQSRVLVSETEVDIALAQNPEDEAQLKLAHLLVALPENATPEQVKTAKEKIAGIKTLIDKGEMDFPAAAIRYSDSPNALEGGDLGWRNRSEIPAEFLRVIDTMKPGGVSEPIRGSTGFQLIAVTDRREAGAQTVTEYSARHLMVRTTEVVDSEQARTKIELLRKRIVGGEEFAEVAKADSDDATTRARGGDMGWFTPDDWGSAVAAQIVQLADNEISQPFSSELGWHLLQRLGQRQQDVTEQNRRARARELIGRRKAEEEYARFLRQIRAEAFVEMRLG